MGGNGGAQPRAARRAPTRRGQQSDTWGRLQQLTYPDKEVLTYKYDSGGLPHSVKGVKLGNEYPNVQKLEYDKFEQRAYLLTGNGVEESFSYNAQDRRLTQKTAGDFQDLQYKYDLVGNITALDNKVPKGSPNEMGGPVEQTFKYDNLYRLTQATGVWHFAPNKTDEQSLSMAYDSIHNITQKTQGHQVVTPGGAIVPQKKTSYAHGYKFSGPQPHAPTQIGDFKYFYDKNGNQTGWDDLKSGQKRVITWDEENRIQAIADNGHKTDFKYNDAGERVIKRGEQGETAYVNQFWTVRNRSVGTKHVFVGETRVSSKVIPGDDHVNPGNDKWAGVLGQWWLHRSAQGWANGKNTVKNPHYAGNAMPDNLPEDNFVFFYHPDHLGSTEYVTDYTGELYEHVQYFAFGETWVSEHKNTEKLPYLFTSKELDEETGLYYFGARYYDPRTSVWQSADPALADFLSPTQSGRGQKPGSVGFAPALLALYSYASLQPTRLTDPTGLEPEEASGRNQIEGFTIGANKKGEYPAQRIPEKFQKVLKPLFKHWKLDPKDVRVRVKPMRSEGYWERGNIIVIPEKLFTHAVDVEMEVMGALAHEMTHVVQGRVLGQSKMRARYAAESLWYGAKGRYLGPTTLASTPIEKVNPARRVGLGWIRGWTLDAVGNRMEYEARGRLELVRRESEQNRLIPGVPF